MELGLAIAFSIVFALTNGFHDDVATLAARGPERERIGTAPGQVVCPMETTKK